MWLSLVVFVVVFIYYMLLVSICCYKRVKAKRDRGNILVDEDVYAACHSFSHTILPKTKKILYMTLVRSHLVYSSRIWRPYLIKDTISLEINDFTSDYKTRLTNLKILPLMYQFELADILFFIKSVKHPTASVNILDYVSFTSSSTRST